MCQKKNGLEPWEMLLLLWMPSKCTQRGSSQGNEKSEKQTGNYNLVQSENREFSNGWWFNFFFFFPFFLTFMAQARFFSLWFALFPFWQAGLPCASFWFLFLINATRMERLKSHRALQFMTETKASESLPWFWTNLSPPEAFPKLRTYPVTWSTVTLV